MDFLIDALLPRRCLHCKLLIWQKIFCSSCRNQFKGASNSSSPDSIYAMFQYGALLRSLILQAKFKPDEAIGRNLASLLYSSIAESELKPEIFKIEYDAVTYVPTHWRRRMNRGYEFPCLLAKAVARAIKSPLHHYLTCTRYDPPLSISPSAAQRLMQTQGRYAAAIRPRNVPLTILLVDDIVTTGATLLSAAKELENLGHKVRCFAFAKTSL